MHHKKGSDLMKKEDMKNAYGTPSDGFHHSVMNALYHLDDKQTEKYTSRKKTLRVALVCALVAVVATTTVAASTNFFGLFSKPVGQYGVTISTNSNASEGLDEDEDEDPDYYKPETRDYIIRMGYVPEGYVSHESNGYSNAFLNGNHYSDSWYFTAFTYDADTYNLIERSVINSEETEFNGHHAIIMTKKFSENSDRISYIVTERFDEENTIVRCEFDGNAYNGGYFEPDKDEMLRIMEGITLEKSESQAQNQYQSSSENAPATDVSSDELIGANKYSSSDKGPVTDVAYYELIEEGKYTFGEIGAAYTEKAANYYDETETALTYKVVSVTEQKDAGDFKKTDFFSAGEGITLYDNYFDEDGNLKTEVTATVVDDFGDGINSLAKTHEVTVKRHFYNVQVEVTADQDIDQLFNVFALSDIAMNDKNEDYLFKDGNSIYLIGYADNGEDSSELKKGQTLIMNFAIIVDEELLPDFCVGVRIGNGLTEENVLKVFRVTK